MSAYCTHTVRVTLTYADTLTGGGGGGGVRVVGWYSAYCTRTVRVTLTYADTLKRGGEGGRVIVGIVGNGPASCYVTHTLGIDGVGPACSSMDPVPLLGISEAL